MPQTDPPYALDMFQTITDCHFGRDVIVVFVGEEVYESQLPLGLTPTDDRVEFLSSWRTPYQAAGFQPGFASTAYRVPSNIGEFMVTTAADYGGDIPFGQWIDALVFAIDGKDIGPNLARAIAGTRLYIPGVYMTHHSVSDLPFDLSPPGLLWAVETDPMAAGAALTWKMDDVDHRADTRPNPPNRMVQCYPVRPRGYRIAIGGAPFDGTLCTGVFLMSYRLDQHGTGQIYSRTPYASESVVQAVDPAWNVKVDQVGDKGIPISDPLPRVSSDPIT